MPRRGRGGAVLAIALIVVGALSGTQQTAADDTETLWAAIRAGTAFVLMRHARAPGTGDPANFDVNDCATQRNLSEDGRRQAVEIGARFRHHGVARAAVYSSAWCRCRETAELLGLGAVESLPALNSFFGRWDRRDPQTAATLAWLAAYEGDGPLVLVAHQVNIRALTGAGTQSGEMVVARRAPDGKIVVLGRL